MFDDISKGLSALRLTDWDSWRERLSLWTAAIICGAVVAGFARLCEWSGNLFEHTRQGTPWLPFVVTPLAGMVVVGLTRRFVPAAEGSGIPQVIAAMSETLPAQAIGKLISLPIAFGKVVLGTVAIGAGFSAGREGPSVQVAAAIMRAFQRGFPLSSRITPGQLAMVGGAAGIAAAFNTPLAGIVFAIEELGRSFDHSANGRVVMTIVLSGLVAIAFLGNYTYFGHISVTEVSMQIVVPVIVCGIVTGIVGGLFSRALVMASTTWHGGFADWRRAHPVLFAGFCGLMVAALGYVSAGAAFGSGYTFARATIEHSAVLPWHFAFDKFMATLLSYLSGIPGGIFAPALAIGAGLGSDLMPLLHGYATEPAVIALAMVGVLSAVTSAPLTSFIIVMEMVDGHAMVLSLMAVAALAQLVARLFGPALYPTLAKAYEKKIAGAPALTEA